MAYHDWSTDAACTPADERAETVLRDIKTVASARDPDHVGRWLWQLLGYAWLDVTDRYRIRAAGLYLARHGVLLTWPIGHLAAALLTDPNGDQRRDVDAAVASWRGITPVTPVAQRVTASRPRHRDQRADH